MQRKIRSEEYRTTIVCVDTYHNGILSGRIFNPYLQSGQSFQSLTQFLQFMEQTLDKMAFPSAFTATRTFAPPPVHDPDPPDVQEQTGQLSTFAIRILFRQNASWQGLVTWMEGKQEQSFRSALELILLIDSALSQPQAQVS